MRDRYIPAFIMLIAGAITCIIDIYKKTELLTSLKRLFWVLIIFYIIGLIARAIINYVLAYRPDTDNQETEEENNENESEEYQKEDVEDNLEENNMEKDEEQ